LLRVAYRREIVRAVPLLQEFQEVQQLFWHWRGEIESHLAQTLLQQFFELHAAPVIVFSNVYSALVTQFKPFILFALSMPRTLD
jgi:hypothetical protein